MPRLRRETTALPPVLRRLEVVAVRDLSPGMRRVTLGGPELAENDAHGFTVPALRTDGFDDHVKVFVPVPGQDVPLLPVQEPERLDYTATGLRPLAKDYTPRRLDLDALELDLDFVRHGDGHASGWVERVRAGDPAWIAGPAVTAGRPHGVDWFLLVGDETALPAIGRFLEELPEGTPAQVVVEVADVAHEQPLRHRPEVEVRWLHRDGAAPGTTDLLVDAVRDAPWWDGEAYVWASGESQAMRAIRSFLRAERPVPRDCLDVTGYWRR